MANALKQDIPEGNVVLLKKRPKVRMLVTGGFGLSDFTMGRAVFGYLLEDDGERESIRIDGYDIKAIDKDQSLPPEFEALRREVREAD